mmetsp:Transcript_39131/g.70174  ORF Transcript_39131/g.70174 Transcript_39131/m.70174 type:complete len:264 (-) Transcript_39131:654-1445(-)
MVAAPACMGTRPAAARTCAQASTRRTPRPRAARAMARACRGTSRAGACGTTISAIGQAPSAKYAPTAGTVRTAPRLARRATPRGRCACVPRGTPPRTAAWNAPALQIAAAWGMVSVRTTARVMGPVSATRIGTQRTAPCSVSPGTASTICSSRTHPHTQHPGCSATTRRVLVSASRTRRATTTAQVAATTAWLDTTAGLATWSATAALTVAVSRGRGIASASQTAPTAIGLGTTARDVPTGTCSRVCASRRTLRSRGRPRCPR